LSMNLVFSFPFHAMCELLWMPFLVEFDDVEVTGEFCQSICI
jgi:hypothetical protein